MNVTLPVPRWRALAVTGAVALAVGFVAVTASAQGVASTRVTIDQAIDMALQHNHALAAARTTIQQSQAQEITANLRPNPVLLGDSQFLPLIHPGDWSTDYLNNATQFDVGVSYLFERGQKRQHRFKAAQDQTAATTAQVDDNSRALVFNVSSQFVGALLAQSDVEFAEKGLASFEQTVKLSESSHDAGAMSDGDLLKIKLQLLQFQMDLSSAKLARVQALASLRQLLGFDAVPADYAVAGELRYQPVSASQDNLATLALRQRPDLRAAQLSVTAAESQMKLAQVNATPDVTAQVNYTHVADSSTVALFANIPLQFFDRNQGEIARTKYAVAQSQELSSEQRSMVLTDVVNAYESLRTADAVVQLYESGYLKQARDSLAISQYGYQHGAASLLDFLDAERSYRATELAYRQALAGHMLALEQLRQAVGTRSLP